jgi:delta 1-pyrroline-5-carboxylate dehydrogenase
MEIRNWIQEKFGGTGDSLLDESVYSNKELRKDISKLEHQGKTLEQEMDDHRRKYKQLLQEGAQYDELKRKKYAQKAKFEKKKYAIKKKKYRANSIKLGTVLSIQGMREIMSLHDQEEIALEGVMEDSDAQEIQSEVMDRMAAFGIEMDDLQEIQDALDIPIMDDNMEMGSSEEEEVMEQIAASEVSAEQVDIESDSTASADAEADVGDIDADIEEGIDMEEVSVEDL